MMPKTFVKDALAPGLFHVGNGLFHRVKSSDLPAYVDSFQKMKAAGHVVPICWEHPPLDQGMPQLSTAYEKAANATRYNAGFVEDLAIVGGKIQAKLNITNPADAARIEAGSVRAVSPRLCNGVWTDGLGKPWSRFFGHVALTNKPRDPSQGGFSPVHMSEFQKQAAVALDVDMADFDDEDDGDDTPTDDNPPPAAAEEAPPAEENPNMPDTSAGDADEKKFEAVVAHLKEFGIHLPDDTDQKNFFDRILGALMTKTAHMQEDDAGDAGDDEQQPPAPVVQQPVQFANHPLYQELLKTRRSSLVEKINAGYAAKKLTPAAKNRLLLAAEAVQLSDSGAEVGTMRLTDVVDLLLSTTPSLNFLEQQVTADMGTEAHHREGFFSEDMQADAQVDRLTARETAARK